MAHPSLARRLVLTFTIASLATLLAARGSSAQETETLPLTQWQVHGWEIVSVHYRMQTTFRGPRDQAEVSRLADIAHRMDRFFDRTASILGIAAPAERLSVFVFATQVEFQAYAERTNYPHLARSGGFYHIPGRTLVTYYREGWHLRRALYHEGTHQIIDLLAPTLEVPVWLNEGLATVFEAMEAEPGEFDPTLANPRRLPVLIDAIEQRRLLPTRELLALDYDAFHVDGFGPGERLHYAQAWGLAHMLVNSEDPADRTLFRAILSRLAERRPVEELLDRDTLAALDVRFVNYVRGIDASAVPMTDPDD